MRTSFLSRWFFAFVAVVAIGIVVTGQDRQESAETRSFLTSYQDMVDLLDRDSVLYEADKEESSVRLKTKRDELDAVMVIRWQAEDGIVQFIQTMPMDVTEDRIPALETAVVRLNHALAVPGFGIEHENRLLYYRFVVPFQPRGGLQDKELRAHFQLTLRQAAEFVGELRQVAGGADPVAIIDQIRRSSQHRHAAAENEPRK